METFKMRQEMCREWGFVSPWVALAAFEAALVGGGTPATPALDFADKAGYLRARAAWRARQRVIEAEIRALKAARKGGSVDACATAQSQASVWRVLAHAALLERAAQKRKAAAQWQAAHVAPVLEAAPV